MGWGSDCMRREACRNDDVEGGKGNAVALTYWQLQGSHLVILALTRSRCPHAIGDRATSISTSIDVPDIQQ